MTSYKYDKSEMRSDALFLLRSLENSEEEGLAYICLIADKKNHDYIEKDRPNLRKYSLEKAIDGMADTLERYMEKCDRISLSDNNLRIYSIKPYFKPHIIDFVYDLIYDISDSYGFGFFDNVYKIEIQNKRKDAHKQKMKNSLQRLLEDLDSLDYTVDIGKSIEIMDNIELSGY